MRVGFNMKKLIVLVIHGERLEADSDKPCDPVAVAAARVIDHA
jgi:hypothetical protein